MKNKKVKPPPTPPEACLSLHCQATLAMDEDDNIRAAGCGSGGTGCSDCLVHEAHHSVIHDQPLIDATKKIRKILEDIQPHSHKHKLSFIHTSQGILLAWVEHGLIPSPGDIVQNEVPEADFVKRLKIKDWKSKK